MNHTIHLWYVHSSICKLYYYSIKCLLSFYLFHKTPIELFTEGSACARQNSKCLCGFSGWTSATPQEVRTTNALIFKMRKQEIQRGTVPGPGAHSTEVAKQGVDSVWPYPKAYSSTYPQLFILKKIQIDRKTAFIAPWIPAHLIQCFNMMSHPLYLCVCTQTLTNTFFFFFF